MDKQLQNILEIINDVFRQLGEPPLFDNPCFKLDSNFSNEFSHCFRTDRQGEKIDMMFIIGDFGIEFHIDRTNELPEYDYKWIQKNKDIFRKDIADIFTSNIETEYKGTKTVLRFLDNQGKQIRQFTFYHGIGFNFLYKSEFKRYKPIFLSRREAPDL